MLFGFPPVLDLIQELIFRADASDAALPLVMASTPIRHGVRHEFHQYLPSFGSSSTWPGAGLGVVLVSTTKSGSRPVFGAYWFCRFVMRFWCAVRMVSHAVSPVACRNARMWSIMKSDGRVVQYRLSQQVLQSPSRNRCVVGLTSLALMALMCLTARSRSVAESDPLTLRHELSCSAASRFALFTEGCASMYFTMPSKMVFAFGSAPVMVATIIIPYPCASATYGWSASGEMISYQPLPQFCLTNADFHRL